jgi:DNA-binding transcriptional ArsR family regulator
VILNTENVIRSDNVLSMTRSQADLLLHPVRLRVLQQLLGGEELTTAELAARLPEVPTASLYRHVARLVEAGVMTVVRERAVRGTTERTYAVELAATQVGADALATMSRQDHLRAFTAFTAGLLGQFERYLEQERIDPVQDRVSYRQAALWLTDEELDDMVDELRTAITRRMANRPAPGRVRRTLSTVLLPDART